MSKTSARKFRGNVQYVLYTCGLLTSVSVHKLIDRRLSFLLPHTEAHFRQVTVSNQAATVHSEMDSSMSSSHGTGPSVPTSIRYPSSHFNPPSGDFYVNPYYDSTPHPNESFASSPMNWTHQAASYGPPQYPSFSQPPQHFPYPQPYSPAPQEPWSGNPQFTANPTNGTTVDVPNIYYDPGSLERNTFAPETEPLEPICDATLFLRRQDSLPVPPPPPLLRHGNFPRTVADAVPRQHPYGNDLSLQDLDFPVDDDDDLSVIGGPHAEV